MKRTCIQCGREFELSGSEIGFYKKKKLSLPKRCKECREQNRTEKKKDASGLEKISDSTQVGDQPKEYGRKKKPTGNQPEEYSGKKEQAGNQPKEYDRTKARTGQPAKREASNRDRSGTQKEPVRDTAAAAAHGMERASAGRSGRPVPKLLAAVLFLIALIYAMLSGQFGQQDEGQQPAAGQIKESREISGQQSTAVSYTFRSEAFLEEHFEKHGREMGFASAADYEAEANNVIASPDALHKLEAEDGDDVYYLEETNEFVIVSTDGYIRTYFKPEDGIAYYNRQ